MQICCIEDFKLEFEKLISKKAYSTLQQDIINYFFNKKVDDLKSGTNLNNSTDTPYIKKRLNGSGGFRVYYLFIIKDEKAYLMFIHPKTGPYGASNIEDKSKAYLYKKVLDSIKINHFYNLTVENNSIIFKVADK